MPEGKPFGARRRNYSPWYSWMVKLQATRLEDPVPLEELESSDASHARDVLAAWLARRRSCLDELLGPLP